jgi:hypothetical protein
MYKFVAVQVLGMVLLVGAGQGLVRAVVDHQDRGLLAWVPGGFVVCVVLYAVLVTLGIGVAAWGDRRRRRTS